MIDDLDMAPPGLKWNEGDRLMVIGPEPKGLSGSAWAFAHDKRNGELNQVDYEMHEKVCDTVRILVNEKLVTAVHDVSTGGLCCCSRRDGC